MKALANHWKMSRWNSARPGSSVMRLEERTITGMRSCLFVMTIVLSAGLSTSCARDLKLTVQHHPNREELYLAYFWPWSRMIDEYGPGVESVRRELKAANYVGANRIWYRAFEEAVPKYMEAHNLIPKECKSGIKVMSTSQDEAGGGTTTFRCR